MVMKAIYIKIPESEYVRFKVFSASRQMSMTQLIRISVERLINEEKKRKND